MTVRWIEDQGSFEALGDAWDGLDAPLPFDLHVWYLTWWRAFGGNAEPALCTAWDGDRLQAVVPLMKDGHGHLLAMANDAHSPVFRPISTGTAELQSAARAVVGRRPAEIALHLVPKGDPSLAVFENAFEQGSFRFVRKEDKVSPIVETGGDFAAWRSESKSRWGAPLERFRRKAQRERSGELLLIEPPRRLGEELAEGFAVEASGWKGRDGSAVLSAPDTERFYTEIAHEFHARGELRLNKLMLDGRLAAFDLCVLYRGTLYLLKTGFDEDLQGPGARSGPSPIGDRTLLRTRAKCARSSGT